MSDLQGYCALLGVDVVHQEFDNGGAVVDADAVRGQPFEQMLLRLQVLQSRIVESIRHTVGDHLASDSSVVYVLVGGVDDRLRSRQGFLDREVEVERVGWFEMPPCHTSGEPHVIEGHTAAAIGEDVGRFDDTQLVRRERDGERRRISGEEASGSYSRHTHWARPDRIRDHLELDGDLVDSRTPTVRLAVADERFDELAAILGRDGELLGSRTIGFRCLVPKLSILFLAWVEVALVRRVEAGETKCRHDFSDAAKRRLRQFSDAFRIERRTDP